MMDKLISAVGAIVGVAIVAIYLGGCYYGPQEGVTMLDTAMEILVGAIVIFVFCIVFAIGCVVIKDCDSRSPWDTYL